MQWGGARGHKGNGEELEGMRATGRSQGTTGHRGGVVDDSKVKGKKKVGGGRTMMGLVEQLLDPGFSRQQEVGQSLAGGAVLQQHDGAQGLGHRLVGC